MCPLKKKRPRRARTPHEPTKRTYIFSFSFRNPWKSHIFRHVYYFYSLILTSISTSQVISKYAKAILMLHSLLRGFRSKNHLWTILKSKRSLGYRSRRSTAPSTARPRQVLEHPKEQASGPRRTHVARLYLCSGESQAWCTFGNQKVLPAEHERRKGLERCGEAGL